MTATMFRGRMSRTIEGRIFSTTAHDMGLLMKILGVLTVIVISGFMGCGQYDRSEEWELEWHFLNEADSSSNIGNPTYSIDLVQDPIYAVIDDISLDSSRLFVAQISMNGRDDDVSHFTSTSKIHLSISYDSIVAFDSTFEFSMLDFMWAYSSIYMHEVKAVSTKDFYIPVQ